MFKIFHESIGTQTYLVDIVDEFFALCGLFRKHPLFQFFADMYPTLNM